MKIEKNFLPVFAGVIAMCFWATMLCVISLFYGPLGNCNGIYFGQYVIGNVSRYADPFLFGIFVTFDFFAWQHQPPSFSWNKVGKFGKNIPNKDEISIGFIIGSVLFLVLLSYKSHLVGYKIPIAFFLYFIFLLTPFGWRGVTVSLAIVTLNFWIVFGLPVATAFFFAVWLGKWLIWWFVNIIRLGFRGAYTKVTRRPSCDHGDEGTDFPQGLGF